MFDLSGKALVHRYDPSKEHRILDGVDLAISPLESICIMGASGTGKSTLLHILSGLLIPESGDVRYNDISILKMTPHQRAMHRAQSMGFVFQNQHFFPQMTVWDNVTLPLRIAGIEIKDQAQRLLKMVNLEGYEDRYPNSLSMGEKARVGLIRALIHHPKVLFADEPSASLDEGLTQSIFKDIKKLQESIGFSMIVASHDPAILSYFDKVYQLHNGQLEVKKI